MEESPTPKRRDLLNGPERPESREQAPTPPTGPEEQAPTPPAEAEAPADHGQGHRARGAWNESEGTRYRGPAARNGGGGV
eukprot:11016316-Alexandrium_andersonii.AAC.1